MTPETEYGGLNAEQPLREGDNVVVDYLAQAGQRFVTTLVRETVEESLDSENCEAELPPGADAAPDKDSTESAVEPAAAPVKVGG